MVHRELSLLNLLSNNNKSAFLFGPRGTGKTSLALEFLAAQPGSLVIDLLRTDQFRRYGAEPSLFRREVERALLPDQPLTVLVDEIQKLPVLLDEIHSLIETYKGRLRFLMTGSSARKLKRQGANLLAGRAWTLHLHPLTHREVALDLERALQFGTLPAVYLSNSYEVRDLTAYVDTYLKEEIMQEALLRRVENFIRFLDIAGQQNGEPINYAAVARDAQVADVTVRDYFSILVDTLICARIDGWSFSTRRQLRQSPKFYFFDCGVLNAVRGELQTEVKSSTYRYGKLFETFVVNEMIRANHYGERGFRFFYWRTAAGVEVDLVAARGPSDQPIAVEIKSRAAPLLQDLKGLQAFAAEHPAARLYCLCTAERAYRLDRIEVLPWREGIQAIMG